GMGGGARGESNFGRQMVTVMGPSRARCVKRTIPRHERAVLPFKEGRMLVASTSALASTALLLPLASRTPPSRPRASPHGRAWGVRFLVDITPCQGPAAAAGPGQCRSRQGRLRDLAAKARLAKARQP